MAALEIHQFPYMSDNYGVLLHSPVTGETAAIDAGDAQALLSALDEKGWNLTELWITHHHGDHTAGLAAVKERTRCRVTGPAQQSAPIDGLDRRVGDGDRFEFAGREVRVLHTPGHTTDMVNYHLPAENLVFTGDTLFALGCGRIFEGNARMMWESLEKLAALPPETVVYCSHEYTLSNAKFALTIDPGNAALKQRAADIASMREKGEPTVPTTIALELATNPFLRAADPAIRHGLGMENAENWQVFAETRKRKDNF